MENDDSYILNHLGEERENYFNAVSPPLIQTSNFAFRTIAELQKATAEEREHFYYSRGANPTLEILQKKLAALDRAEDCLLFGSGAAAIFASVLANVKSGDHIISVRNPYTWAQRTFDVILPRFGVETTYIDGRDITHFENAKRPSTKLIYLESPSSWKFEIQDIAAVTTFAKRHGITTIVDNSYSTPLYQKPIVLGADFCLQSATKYLSGHSDTLGGVLTGSKEMIQRIFYSEYLTIGSGMAPFNAWLILRGLRTLKTRLERISRTTAEVVQFLKSHPRVNALHFPFDPAYPQYELAKKQMSGACGLLSFSIKGASYREISKFAESLKSFLMAVSWGGHESLVVPKCVGLKESEFKVDQPDHRLIRIYIGLEDAEYLIKDLKQALDLVA